MVETHSMPACAPAPDSISPNFAPISHQDRSVRRYTVTDGLRNIRDPDGRSVPAPMLRLRGAWLKRAGFAIGVRVTVRVSAGRLVIEVAEPERVPQTEAFAKIAQVADGYLPKRDLDAFIRSLKLNHTD